MNAHDIGAGSAFATPAECAQKKGIIYHDLAREVGWKGWAIFEGDEVFDPKSRTVRAIAFNTARISVQIGDQSPGPEWRFYARGRRTGRCIYIKDLEHQ